VPGSVEGSKFVVLALVGKKELPPTNMLEQRTQAALAGMMIVVGLLPVAEDFEYVMGCWEVAVLDFEAVSALNDTAQQKQLSQGRHALASTDSD
jgi:hypothetical protein